MLRAVVVGDSAEVGTELISSDASLIWSRRLLFQEQRLSSFADMSEIRQCRLACSV